MDDPQQQPSLQRVLAAGPVVVGVVVFVPVFVVAGVVALLAGAEHAAAIAVGAGTLAGFFVGRALHRSIKNGVAALDALQGQLAERAARDVVDVNAGPVAERVVVRASLGGAREPDTIDMTPDDENR